MRLNAIEAGSAGTPVILLHGLFGQARNLGRLQRRLAASRRTLALDLRSHGASPAGRLDLREMAGDVVEALDARGIERGAFIGHSLGGKVAMAAALDHPGRVERLVVADIAPVPYRHGNIRLARALQSIPLAPGLTRSSADAVLAGTVADPGLRGFLLQNLVLGAPPRWRLGLDDIAASLDEAEGWPSWADDMRYAGPTLFVRGGRSDYVGEAHVPTIRALFPNAGITTIEGAGHWLHAERPEAFETEVEGFLRS